MLGEGIIGIFGNVLRDNGAARILNSEFSFKFAFLIQFGVLVRIPRSIGRFRIPYSLFRNAREVGRDRPQSAPEFVDEPKKRARLAVRRAHGTWVGGVFYIPTDKIRLVAPPMTGIGPPVGGRGFTLFPGALFGYLLRGKSRKNRRLPFCAV